MMEDALPRVVVRNTERSARDSRRSRYFSVYSHVDIGGQHGDDATKRRETTTTDKQNNILLQRSSEGGKGINSVKASRLTLRNRLTRRKTLLSRSRSLVDLSVAAACVGVVAMLVETELYVQKVVSKSEVASLTLRISVTLSTVLLLLSVVVYNITTVQLAVVNNSLDDWRLVISPPLVCSVILELVVCSVHPPPLSLQPKLESALSVLMFLRLYLLVRFLVVHSRYLTDTATSSLGALSKVPIDAQFVFKALMSEWPGSMLLISMVAIFSLSGWSVRTCEAYVALAEHRALNETPARDIPEAFWFSAITFLTVGYGDVVPSFMIRDGDVVRSECGRVVAVVVGLLGVGVTALLVAVLANKLQLSRAEKYVHTFSTRIELDNRHKNAAADVIKNAIKLWRMRDLANQTSRGRRVHVQGKLMQAIRLMKDARQTKANIGEAVVGVVEVHSLVTDIACKVEDLKKQLAAINGELHNLVAIAEDRFK
ncbi:hypothetical protein C0Q70_19640 [Pomacea canaliculata]|uniref:Calmodulin-binding domain-containing protein n=1 Tax=Pomacea canaliculata TaxID=400727 RepID=A0A2T7NJX7_POMCA|nr:hypothetical protein C0Q70_19640 [Pomacea canaliculata]